MHVDLPTPPPSYPATTTMLDTTNTPPPPPLSLNTMTTTTGPPPSISTSCESPRRPEMTTTPTKRHSSSGGIPTSPEERPPLPRRNRSRSLHLPGFREDLEAFLVPALPSLPRKLVAHHHLEPSPPAPQYPHSRFLNRCPPCIGNVKRIIPTQHHSAPRAVAAASDLRLATASYSIRMWDSMTGDLLDTLTPNPTTHQEMTDKVTCLAFAPTRIPHQDGWFLWAGLEDGHLTVIDTHHHHDNNKGNNNMTGLHAHKTAIRLILRVHNTEIWTIDDSGALRRWPAPHHNNNNTDCTLDGITHDGYNHRVTPQALAAVVVDDDANDCYHLVMTSGKTLDVYRFVPWHSSQGRTHVRMPCAVKTMPRGFGLITQMVLLSHYKNNQPHIACAHDTGIISIWCTRTWELVQQVVVSSYSIAAMALSNDRFLWAGYKTGMIYVYDISDPNAWAVVKAWEAHQAPVIKLLPNENMLGICYKPCIEQVISVDAHANVKVWDGRLEAYQKERQVQEQRERFTDYRSTRIMVCSWNIDACSPENLNGEDDALLRKWLESMDDPDLIVIGLQEIVDLESKRQTAKSMLFNRKKRDAWDVDPALLEAAIPQYKAWTDYLTSVVQSNFKMPYTLIKSEHLVGLFSLIFVKQDQEKRVNHTTSAVVKTGLKVMRKSIHGNKGAVAIRLTLDDASLCFVNCHLAAGQSRADHRNADAEEILKSARFDPLVKYMDDSTILDHDHVFFSGDLNYRVDKWTRDNVIEWLTMDDKSMAYKELLDVDQLVQQRRRNPLLKLAMFDEAPITFNPTYKYNVGKDTYDSSEKKRVPAWCDRILFYNVPQPMFYQRHEVKASDHRPIRAGFELLVKSIRQEDKQKVEHEVEAKWNKTVAEIIQDHKARYVADFGQCTVDQARERLIKVDWDVERAVCELVGVQAHQK